MAPAPKDPEERRSHRVIARITPALHEALELATSLSGQAQSALLERLLREAVEGEFGYGCWVPFDRDTAQRLSAIADARGQPVWEVARDLLRAAAEQCHGQDTKR